MISLESLKLGSIQLRIGVLIFVPFILFTILVIQLWNMQVFHRDDYLEKSKRQSARSIRIPAIRGRILARDGSPLADNRVSYDVKLHLSEMRKTRRKDTIMQILSTAAQVADCIGRENPLTRARLLQHMNLYPGIPLELFKDLNDSELGRLWENAPRFRGLEITAEPVRCYPNGPLAAQTIGYVGSSDPKQADDRAEFFYYIADLCGKSGLERLYDEKLRGSPGGKLVMVNSAGFIHELLEPVQEARNGFDVVLTLDLRAQKIAERLLRETGKSGALVLLNADTGEVLALASNPSYAPAEFVPRISAAAYKRLHDDPARPFLNRAVQGAYMPGSIIKPLAALACLENGISPDAEVICTGRSPHGYGGIRCNSRYGHGPMTVSDAIKKSCNVFFIDNGVKIGIDALSRVYRSAGIGSPTGIEIAERRGILPKNSEFWPVAETAYVAFGQGRVEVTPLQAAVYIAAIANGGTRWKPFLVKQIIDSSHADHPVTVFDGVPHAVGRLAASPASIAVVQEGMHRVVNEPGGSGVAAHTPAIDLSGKTGTADVASSRNPYKNVWFAAFGSDPKAGTRYAFVVVVEHGESGAKTAAPLAGKFFTEWLSGGKATF